MTKWNIEMEVKGGVFDLATVGLFKEKEFINKNGHTVCPNCQESAKKWIYKAPGADTNSIIALYKEGYVCPYCEIRANKIIRFVSLEEVDFDQILKQYKQEMNRTRGWLGNLRSFKLLKRIKDIIFQNKT